MLYFITLHQPIMLLLPRPFTFSPDPFLFYLFRLRSDLFLVLKESLIGPRLS